MNFKRDQIRNAILHTLANLLDGDARFSAKSLEGTIGSFFTEAAGIRSANNKDGPEGYCYPYRASLDSIRQMCKAIFAQVAHDDTCRHSEIKLIRKICELSESHMERFRQERDAGTYGRNIGYICALSPDNDWGRWMIALREEFFWEESREDELKSA